MTNSPADARSSSMTARTERVMSFRLELESRLKSPLASRPSKTSTPASPSITTFSPSKTGARMYSRSSASGSTALHQGCPASAKSSKLIARWPALVSTSGHA